MISRSAFLLSAALTVPCAASAQEHPDILELQVAVLQEIIDNNHAHAPEGPNTAICVGVGGTWDMDAEDLPDLALAQLSSEDLPIVHRSRCVLDEERRFRGQPRARLVLRETMKPAISVTVESINAPVVPPTTVWAGYYEDVLSGAAYSCRVEPTDAGWTVNDCELSVIS